jgi:predicted nicotinamide N-methyase
MAMSILPPTAQLPPIKSLKTVPVAQLHEAIQYLRNIYNPEIRCSRRVRCHQSSQNGSNTRGPSDDNEDKAMEAIRADAFEHAYAMRWLTALISQTTLTTTTLHKDECEYDYDYDREPLVQSAAALLAVCAGPASAGKRTRTYVLGGVRVQLTDVALQNDDFGSVGAQTWGSACVLAEMIAETPWRFGLCDRAGVVDGRPEPSLATPTRIIRVLELGAGTGLVSLTVGKILQDWYRHRHRQLEAACGRSPRRVQVAETRIVASDFHPIALENLKMNIEKNGLNGGHDNVVVLSSSSSESESESAPTLRGKDDSDVSVSVSAYFLDWEEVASNPAHVLGAPFDAPFDEVFGADVVYEPDHAAWINACLKRLLCLTGRFHLVMPLREGFAHELASVERVFPRAEGMCQVIGAGPTLCITEKENITCEVGPEGAPGAKGNVDYAHYTIQWVVGRQIQGRFT